ncbi:DUF3027 domain-containing protein [Rothia nasimurium]|uniref:DUF3027 domain-containing protein n=1 Tax=Rothia nasimurium TaxID=85336 RepID=UPI002DD68DCA|nr:DUF3027 domain-containing protein [Rothia nasimurium]
MTEEVKDELTAPVASSAESYEQPGLETAEQAPAPAPEPTLGEPTRRRRTSKVDAVLAAAKDVALAGLADIAPENSIGPVHHLRGEEERLTTHLFECTLPGYRGWFWFATLSRAPRSKVATVCEIGLLPGDDALLAPAWVPWADRLLPEDQEAQDYDHEDVDYSDVSSENEDSTEAAEENSAEDTQDGANAE